MVGKCIALAIAVAAPCLIVDKVHPADPPAKTPIQVKDPPASWKLEPFSGKPLVWEIIKRDGGIEWQRCLLLNRSRAGNGMVTFNLSYLERCTNDESPRWQHLAMHLAPKLGPKGELIDFGGWRWSLKTFKTPPSDDEIQAFLREWYWDRDAKTSRLRLVRPNKTVTLHRKLTAGGICAANWKELLNREPSELLFPELSLPTEVEKK